MNLTVSNEILATQFPKFLKLRMIDCGYACKEEATSANAHLKRKKGHFGQKISPDALLPALCTVANHTREWNSGA
jgi:hypothetical protein